MRERVCGDDGERLDGADLKDNRSKSSRAAISVEMKRTVKRVPNGELAGDAYLTANSKELAKDSQSSTTVQFNVSMTSDAALETRSYF